MILADSCEQFSVEQGGCCVVNPSSFTQEYSFVSYTPADGDINFSVIANSYTRVEEEEDDYDDGEEDEEILGAANIEPLSSKSPQKFKATTQQTLFSAFGKKTIPEKSDDRELQKPSVGENETSTEGEEDKSEKEDIQHESEEDDVDMVDQVLGEDTQ